MKLVRLIPERLRNRYRDTPLPPWAVPWLPGTSLYFGPPRRWMSAETYFGSNPGSCRIALPGQVLPVPSPAVVGDVPRRFLSSFRTQLGPARVFTVNSARLLGPDGWVVAPRDTFLIDASHDGIDPEVPLARHKIFRTRRGMAPRARLLRGRTLSLASDFAVGGFGHFIHDSLTRLLLVELAGMKATEFDWVYLPRLKTAAVAQLASKLGVPSDRLLDFTPGTDILCEELTATTFPGAPGTIAPAYAEFLRKRFGPKPAAAGRRVYLSRRGFRRTFSNSAGVEKVLQAFGFEEVCADLDERAIAKCAEAEAVFGIEGANLFNAAFCRAGTRILVVFPDGLPHSRPYVLSLAEACGLKATIVSARTQYSSNADGGIADVEMDLGLLDSALRQLLN